MFVEVSFSSKVDEDWTKRGRFHRKITYFKRMIERKRMRKRMWEQDCINVIDILSTIYLHESGQHHAAAVDVGEEVRFVVSKSRLQLLGRVRSRNLEGNPLEPKREIWKEEKERERLVMPPRADPTTEGTTPTPPPTERETKMEKERARPRPQESGIKTWSYSFTQFKTPNHSPPHPPPLPPPQREWTSGYILREAHKVIKEEKMRKIFQ